MERSGVGMISNSFTAQDFRNLDLKVYSEKEKWDTAISIINERFEERYFNPIQGLRKNTYSNGFAMMALNCLLVDTFYQFEKGVEETTNNRTCYTKFLKTYLGDIVPDDDVAIKFYKDIRCGILHSAQTKNGSILSIENSQAVEYYNGHSSLKVNVDLFSDRLKAYFDAYIERLRQGDKETRENFITKMYYICK